MHTHKLAYVCGGLLRYTHTSLLMLVVVYLDAHTSLLMLVVVYLDKNTPTKSLIFVVVCLHEHKTSLVLVIGKCIHVSKNIDGYTHAQTTGYIEATVVGSFEKI
jgi:hypothetical protein